MTAENSARGLANRRAGHRAMYRAVTWLREHGAAPCAEKTSSPHKGDMVTGVGDQILEVTVESWQAIGAKADQAARDAASMGYSRWCIWKPRRGVGDMGGAWCITEFRQYWALVREVDKLRRLTGALAIVVDPAKLRAALDSLALTDPAAAELLSGVGPDDLLKALQRHE